MPKETVDTCPTCDADSGFNEVETEDEQGYYRHLVCRACDAKTDEDELIALRNAKRKGSNNEYD